MAFQRVTYKTRKELQAAYQVSNELFNHDGVRAYGCLIPATYTSAELIYFVDSTSGCEFGQFETAEQAINEAKKMASLPQEERADYDR